MAVAVLNTNTNLYTASSSSPTGNQTVNAGGTNVVAICHATFRAPGYNTLTVTYGGQTMTSAGTPINIGGAADFAGLWYLINPPTGSNSLVLSFDVSSATYMDITAFAGVDQATPIRAGSYTVANATSTSPSISIPSAVGDLVTSVIVWTEGAATPGLTQINQDRTGDINLLDDYGLGDVTVVDTWTISSQGWAMAGLSLQAAAGAAPPPIARSTLRRTLS